MGYLVILFLLSGCATIIDGQSQDIFVNTNPVGAKCEFSRQGAILGDISSTPGDFHVEKNKYDLIITCNKKGYEESTYINHSGTAGSTFGNILAGGLIGWGVDSATGSDNKYESPVNITLNKK